jgi:ATP-dependent Clp protease ATP-binding subunit ClpX
VGKTYLVRLLAEFLQVPVGFSSAAGLVEAGYKGDSVETLVGSLLDRAGGDPRQAEKGIVFVDEIDKIRALGVGGARDISGQGVQNALLTFLDGRISKGQEGSERPAVDTARLLFVCTGAFVGLDEIVRARLGEGRGRIGFRLRAQEADDVKGLPDQPLYEALCQVQTEDLVRYGMIPEFVGRFATITVLHELNQKALRRILKDSMEHSALKQQQCFARIHGIDLVFSDEALDAIAEEAEALGCGARGLHRLIGQVVDGVDARWSELADEGVCRVEVNRAVVVGTGEPVLVRGKAVSERKDLRLRKESLRGLPNPLLGSPSSFSNPAVDHSITDTRNWTDEQLKKGVERIKKENLRWDEVEGHARAWWTAFEEENKHRWALVFRLAEELRNRKATISEFFWAYEHSQTDNIQANLYFLDYLKLKKKDGKH